MSFRCEQRPLLTSSNTEIFEMDSTAKKALGKLHHATIMRIEFQIVFHPSHMSFIAYLLLTNLNEFIVIFRISNYKIQLQHIYEEGINRSFCQISSNYLERLSFSQFVDLVKNNYYQKCPALCFHWLVPVKSQLEIETRPHYRQRGEIESKKNE